MPLEDGSFVTGGTVSQEYKVSYVEEPVLILSFVRPGVPQLFFRLAYYDLPLPSSCADIYLQPEYI